MNLSKTAKTIIGVLTIFQLFAGLGFVVWIIASVLPQAVAAAETNPGPEFALSIVGGMVIWSVFLSIYTFGLMVFYLVHAGTNKQTSTGIKVLWIVLILLFAFLAEVVYFFLEILPEKSISAKLEN